MVRKNLNERYNDNASLQNIMDHLESVTWDIEETGIQKEYVQELIDIKNELGRCLGRIKRCFVDLQEFL